MRLIDADALMQTLGITDTDCDKCAWYNKEYMQCKRGDDFEDVCCAIEDAPTIDAIPARIIPPEIYERSFQLRGAKPCSYCQEFCCDGCEYRHER